jgi:uncharacterized repeat protein (TIGR01451 family)
MRRTLAMVVSGLLLVGFVVAMLPAQDSSRRGGSIYAEPSSDDDSPLREPAHFPREAVQNAQAAAPNAATDALKASQLRRRAAYEERWRTAPAAAAESPAEPAPPADDGGLHSILKRAQDAAAQPTPDAASAAETDRGILAPPPGATSSRRTQRRIPGRAAEPTVSPTARIQDVQLGGRAPSLRVEMVGPGAIQVGKPARYTIYANNEGDVAAQDLVVQLPLPARVTLTKGEATAGDAEVRAAADGTPTLVWNVPMLAPRGHETLQLQLVATEGEAFDLHLEWACRPATSSARVTVKQPQLHLSLTGPADMLLGQQRPFTLVVSNPGTGDAENVVVDVSSGAGQPQRIDVGTVPAGQQIDVPIQVLASQPGEMPLAAVAKAEGQLTAETSGKVLVRSAELSVAVSGPQLKFAGAEAVYRIELANRGNATGESTTLTIELPEAAKYLGGIDGASAGKGAVRWNVGAVAPGAEKRYEIRVQLLAEGENRLVATAETKSGLAASGEAVTTVEAVSELKLAVNDPSGPTPVGQEVEYEIQVANRGTRAAEQIKMVMQFGEGLEPTTMIGGKGKIVPGQVICEPLRVLEAGEQVALKVRAKADKAGAHQFRVEVTSSDGARLVTEGTSRFFSETRASSATAPADVPPGKAGRTPADKPASSSAAKSAAKPTPAKPTGR